MLAKEAHHFLHGQQIDATDMAYEVENLELVLCCGTCVFFSMCACLNCFSVAHVCSTLVNNGCFKWALYICDNDIDQLVVIKGTTECVCCAGAAE